MTEQNPIYMVQILRRDQNHLEVISSADFNKCLERWKELHQLWAESSKEEKPFVLEDPILTAFQPGLITEIRLIPINADMQNQSNNPYQKHMMQNGLGATLPSTSGTDILDNGYRG